MSRQRAAGTAVEVRPYRAQDESLALDLLRTTRGAESHGRWSAEFFRWKHVAGPFGPSVVLVAEADGCVVGLRAFMRWRFQAEGRTVEAVRAVDTATHPEYRGRGVFSRLTQAALDLVRDDAALVFNTPNKVAEPGYLKLGWRVVGKVPVLVRIQHPLRFVVGLRSVRDHAQRLAIESSVQAETAREALGDDASAALLEEEMESGSRLTTVRHLEYLRWRYASAPGLDYRAVREHDGGQLSGLAIFRVRTRGRLREATVSELIGRPEEDRVLRTLLRRVMDAAAVDHLTCAFPPGSPSARVARSCDFMRVPGGITLAVMGLRKLDPDPTDLRSWALSLGDLEVF